MRSGFIIADPPLIEDGRFTKIGLRPDGVFLGERDHLGEPLPEFIGANAAISRISWPGWLRPMTECTRTASIQC
jgi:hypothetical protein